MGILWEYSGIWWDIQLYTRWAHSCNGIAWINSFQIVPNEIANEFRSIQGHQDLSYWFAAAAVGYCIPPTLSEPIRFKTCSWSWWSWYHNLLGKLPNSMCISVFLSRRATCHTYWWKQRMVKTYQLKFFCWRWRCLWCRNRVVKLGIELFLPICRWNHFGSRSRSWSCGLLTSLFLKSPSMTFYCFEFDLPWSSAIQILHGTSVA